MPGSFTSAFPIITSPDLTRALRFYVEVLDAKVAYQFPPEGDPAYVGVKIGESEIGLSQADSLEPTDAKQRIAIWIYADDCVAAVERLRAAGARIIEEPTRQPWGDMVARASDPDGNELIIGSVEK